jgi:hypothetical protein
MLFYSFAIKILAFAVLFLLEILHLIPFVNPTLICIGESLWR